LKEVGREGERKSAQRLLPPVPEMRKRVNLSRKYHPGCGLQVDTDASPSM
jgi:hypothetical protein